MSNEMYQLRAPCYSVNTSRMKSDETIDRKEHEGMKVGINILNFGPGTRPATLLNWAQFSAAAGFHLIMISDHLVSTPDVQQLYPAPLYDPLLTLAWLAPQLPTLELGTTVLIVPYRHPLHTARLVANLDQFSGGRLILGVGVGWARQEFAALGVPFPQRGRLTDEYLAAMKVFWTTEIASYRSRFVTFEGVHSGPQPVQAPHPPLWVAGSSAAALRRAVRFGAAWHPIGVRGDWLRKEGLPALHMAAEEAGQPLPALCPRINLRLTERPLADDQRTAGQGTLEQVRQDIIELMELGAQYVVLDTYTGTPEDSLHPEQAWAMLATLAEQVFDLPRQRVR